MSRNRGKQLKDKEDIKNLTKRERLLSKCFSLIFHLNNNQQRYSIEYRGYMLILSKLNFDKREWEVLEEHNFTQMEYSKSAQVIHDINKHLYKELIKFTNDIEWEDLDG